MANHLHILHEIEKIQGFLIEKGYVTQQNFVKAMKIYIFFINKKKYMYVN